MIRAKLCTSIVAGVVIGGGLLTASASHAQPTFGTFAVHDGVSGQGTHDYYVWYRGGQEANVRAVAPRGEDIDITVHTMGGQEVGNDSGFSTTPHCHWKVPVGASQMYRVVVDTHASNFTHYVIRFY